ncbi:girdin [Agrilus planipennis]|uniref:Girdin n=1 Tax=Agrilus planipennis TaxID=224129 RepID=A0A1W4XUR2_AGRPL|nr:girdin [Agrilus planipennis]
MSNNNFIKKTCDYYGPGSVIYNKTHSIDVFFSNGLSELKTVCITLVSLDGAVAVKIKEIHDYFFNYEAIIDSYTFEKMKSEQSLEIHFDEIRFQIVELLKEISSKETFVKLEVENEKCQLIFYGKSKIKCVVFLVIDLKLTDPREIINEMANCITSLKEKHEYLLKEIHSLRREIATKDAAVKDICTKKNSLEKEFYQQLDSIYTVALKEQNVIEKKLNMEIQHLMKKVTRMLSHVERLDNEILLKHESDAQLLQGMQNMKLENEKNHSTINELKTEIIKLNSDKAKMEKDSLDLKWAIDQKNRLLEELEKKNGELEKDMKEATKIIAQKSQINDEIAKDLVQANQMLVNFNYHYDNISKECDNLKEQLQSKELIIEQQQSKLNNLCKEFTSYKKTYSQEEISKLKRQLEKANEKLRELEKQNREAVMLNNVLTKKLSATEFLENQNPNAFANM